MKLKSLIAAAMLATPAIYAENLVVGGDAESGSAAFKGKTVTTVTTAPYAGKASFTLTGQVTTAKTDLIAIDATKNYRLSGVLRSVDPEKRSIACFGLTMYNADKKVIHRTAVWVMPGTETELIAEAPKGTMEIFVKDASAWNKRRTVRSQVAFNAKADLSDLPNFEYTSLVSRVKRADDGNGWVVKFDRPLPKAYPAGTIVRQHNYGASLDCCLAWRAVPAEWTSYSAELKGTAALGTAPGNQFWPGTKFVSVYLMNDAGRKGAAIEFDNIVFEEVK